MMIIKFNECIYLLPERVPIVVEIHVVHPVLRSLTNSIDDTGHFTLLHLIGLAESVAVSQR